MSAIDKALQALGDLIVSDTIQQLPGTPLNTLAPSLPGSFTQLVFFASWQALLDDAKARERAYEIATRLAQRAEIDDPTVAACSEILGRLGNFPAQQLLNAKTGSYQESVPLRFLVESAFHRQKNTITVGAQTITLTDFQVRIEEQLSQNRKVTSVSAPTSAGKSFLLCLDVSRRFLNNPNISTICFVVPTRALSRQTAGKIRENLQGSGLKNVSVRVLPPKDESDIEGRTVFVFTQERLLSLLGDTENTSIDVLFVDEAQGVNEGGRGVLLQQGIERTLARSTDCKAVVIAPMVKNPEAFGDIFGISDIASLPFAESLVTQNVVIAETVKNRPKQCAFRLRQGSSWRSLGTTDLGFRFRKNNKTQAIADFAMSINSDDDVTLVYATGPKRAEDIALEIASKLPDSSNEALYELADFVSQEFHEDYPLTKTLPKGVAFHYSMMPGLARTRVEEMVEDGAINFITATTTLLSGVNLPLKNLVIESPRKGSKAIMNGFEFWNLAGRAGRLGREFQGNIWILKLDDWARDVYDLDRNIAVKSSYEELLRNDPEKLITALADADAPVSKDTTADAAASKILHDAMVADKDFSESRFSDLVPKWVAREIDSEVARLKGELPISLATAAPGISPARTAKLWRIMKEHQLKDIVPLHPLRDGSYTRLKGLMRLLQQNLMNDTSQTYSYWTFVANNWLREEQMRDMIASKISYDTDKSGSEPQASDSIRELLDTLERSVRFICARNFRIFTAAFQELCVERRQLRMLERAAPVSMYLDAGAYTMETLTLLSLGFSRTSAIKIANQIRGQGEEGVRRILDDPRWKQRLQDVLPAICMAEFNRFSR